MLLLAFWVTFLIALGGTTPVPRWIFGRAFEILTYERFTLWATVLALPIVGLLVEQVIDRFPRWGAIGVSTAAVASLALALGWLTWSPFRTFSSLNVDSVVAFLNRDGHDQYRYLTLGFGNALSKVSTYANANSVDGEYNSARLLPEMTRYGAAQLTSAKFFGVAGMDSLRAMLQHANHYGLKFIFVHDPFYEPLLVFGGWRQVESYDSGAITVWSKDDAVPARTIPSDAMPAPWEGLMWGILPIGSSVLAILFVWLLVEPRRAQEADHASQGNAGRRLRQWGALMKWGLVAFLTIATAVLVAFAWLQSGGMKQHAMFSAATPEEAVQALMSQIQAHNYRAGLCFARSQQRYGSGILHSRAGGKRRQFAHLFLAADRGCFAAARRWLTRLWCASG